MKEFWIVCGWDKYYPCAGLGDIVAVCFSRELAEKIADEHKHSVGACDYYEVCHSSELPWVQE